MPSRNPPATAKAPKMVCGNVTSAVLLVKTAHASVIVARPLTISVPTGCCIQEFATRMKYAERIVASEAHQMVARWMRLGRRPQPKIHKPRNVDSTKKASSASIASGAPKTSPTKRLYSLHAMPNWNSCTIPVATPMMKLMRKSFPQNLVMRRYSSLPVRCHAVCITATTSPRPIVRGTIRK